MPITQPGRMADNNAIQHRAAITAADAATYTDAVFDPATVVDCAGWETVLVYGRFTGGAAPTVSFEVLVKGPAPTNDWIRLAPKTTATAEGIATEIKAYGRKLMFRVDAFTGAPTSMLIFVAGGKAMKFDGSSRS